MPAPAAAAGAAGGSAFWTWILNGLVGGALQAYGDEKVFGNRELTWGQLAGATMSYMGGGPGDLNQNLGTPEQFGALFSSLKTSQPGGRLGLQQVGSKSSESQIEWAFDPWLMWRKERYQDNWRDNVLESNGGGRGVSPDTRTLSQWFADTDGGDDGTAWGTHLKNPESTEDWWNWRHDYQDRDFELSRKLLRRSIDEDVRTMQRRRAEQRSLEMQLSNTEMDRMIRANSRFVPAGDVIKVPRDYLDNNPNPYFNPSLYGEAGDTVSREAVCEGRF